MQIRAIFAENSRASIEEALSELRPGNPSIHSIYDNIRRDGSRLACEWFAGAIHDSTGGVQGVVSMARDVTDRELLESRLRDAHKLESLGVLASGVAHDFNSILMLILGNASLLRASRTLSRKAIGYLDAIEEASQRANHLVKHLLAYARTGRHNPQVTNLNNVICDCLSFLQSSLGKDHYIRAELADDLPLVMADRHQLEQIILNLCLNSRHAMPEGGEIVIATRCVKLDAALAARCVPYNARPGEKVEMILQDSGCGMDASTVARIFDPFYTTKPEGHGLGLSAVLGILQQHQGAARVESELGRGTTMRIYLPIIPQGQDLGPNI